MGAAAIPALISAGGAIAGGLLSSKGSKQAGTTNTIQSNDPWVGAQPYLSQGFGQASGLLGNQDWRATQDALRLRALVGSPVTDAAQNLATSTIRGDYLRSNPFQNETVQDAMGMARSQINSQFGPFSNYGSSGHQEWLGRGLMNAALPYLSQNYENERGRQYAAMAQAPALAGTDYQDLGALQQADFMPWDFLGRYQGIVSGLNPGGGTTTTSQPYFSNPYSGAIGGAMLANQLYNSYQSPPTWYGGPAPSSGY